MTKSVLTFTVPFLSFILIQGLPHYASTQHQYSVGQPNLVPRLLRSAEHQGSATASSMVNTVEDSRELHDTNLTNLAHDDLTTLAEQAMAGAAAAVSDAIAPLTARQEAFKLRTDDRITKLHGELKNISRLIHPKTSALQTCSQVDEPTPVRAPESLTPYSLPSTTTSPRERILLSSGSRTLGFFPITQSHTSSTEGRPLHHALDLFMKNALLIPIPELARIEVKKIWYNSKKSMLLAEFYSIHMCHIVFKYMKNLQAPNRIEKYIPPCLKTTYQDLARQAYELRHRHGYFSTRVDYDCSGLVLLCKPAQSSPWTVYKTPAPTRNEVTAGPIASDICYLATPTSVSTQLTAGTTSPIQQVDGMNDSLMSTSSNNGHCSSIASHQASGTSLTYNYSLNHQHQTKRLVTSALKEPLSVTYKDYKIIDDVRYAFNVNVEFNSGLYLTAIKPVLETVTLDWKANVGNWVVCCSKVSPRHDQSHRHLVCTQLTLNLVPKDQRDDSSSHKLTVHFYHTKDKIQVQGSSIISPGISSPVWLVQNLIEPMAVRHTETNQQLIDKVNSDIIHSSSTVSTTCQHCKSGIELTTTRVRDQPLTCCSCSSLFHKRCTDRSGARGGRWSRDPWLCPPCRGSSAQSSYTAAFSQAPHLPPSSITSLTQQTSPIQLLVGQWCSCMHQGLLSGTPPQVQE